MYSQKMEALIEASLQDGILSDQEKLVLIKCANEEGIDLNELDVYISSLLQKRKQEQEEQELAEERKKVMGVALKCPRCGGSVQSYMMKCPHCDYFFEGIERNKTIMKLLEMQNAIPEGEQHDERVQKILTDYPIPENKAELLEFTKYIYSLYEQSQVVVETPLVVKLKQCFEKAESLIPDDKDFLTLKEKFIKKNTENKASAKKLLRYCSIFFAAIIFMMVCVFVFDSNEKDDITIQIDHQADSLDVVLNDIQNQIDADPKTLKIRLVGLQWKPITNEAVVEKQRFVRPSTEEEYERSKRKAFEQKKEELMKVISED